jgi:hypothetical protein
MLLESSTFPVKEISVHSLYPIGTNTHHVHIPQPVDQKPCNTHVLEVEIPLSPIILEITTSPCYATLVNLSLPLFSNSLSFLPSSNGCHLAFYTLLKKWCINTSCTAQWNQAMSTQLKLATMLLPYWISAWPIFLPPMRCGRKEKGRGGS